MRARLFALAAAYALAGCVRGAPASTHASEGLASFYSDRLEGQRTASGERYLGARFTAAHRTLPFGACVRVTHLGNGRTVTVTVNDRGPYAPGRVIDLSKAAARALDLLREGVARVRLGAC